MRSPLSLLLCVALVAGAGCQTAAPSTPAAQQAAAFNRNQEDLRDDVESTGVVDRFIAIGALLVSPIVTVAHDIGQRLDLAEGHTPAVAARMMNQSTDPDVRRQGIALLVTRWSFTHRPPYTTRYQQIAQTDPDYTVRAMAIRALNISRDATATPIFVAALDDPSELVRLEAAKALANVPDPAAVPSLLRMVEGRPAPGAIQPGEMPVEAKDVRIAAADALRHYRTLDVARSLVSVLNERDFGVAWQSRKSLVAMTGRDLRYDQAAWLAYLAGNASPFV